MWTEVERVAGNIYTGGKPTRDSGLLKGTVAQLSGCLSEGYNAELKDIAYNAPDFDMLFHLSQDVYHFSAAKNYQQLKDMTLALFDGKRILSEAEYIKAVEKLNLTYNSNWLSVERDTAIAGGQMAAAWARFDENALLKYITAGDSRVRPGHRRLNGVRKKKNDLFWKTYYPPNGYRCRCDVTEVDEGFEPTRDSKIVVPDVPPMFKVNLSEQGLIFPKNHPYYNGVPKGEIKKAISYLPPENTYLTTKADNGFIDINVLHGVNETKQNLEIANDLLNAGYTDIKLLPVIHEKEAFLRKKFLPKDFKQVNEKKNPDALMKDKSGKNIVCDFKYMTGNGNRLSGTLTEAAEQAEYAVVKFAGADFPRNRVHKIVASALERNENLKGVILLNKEGKIEYQAFKK